MVIRSAPPLTTGMAGLLADSRTPRGKPVSVVAADYLLRTMRPGDAGDALINWLQDGDVLRGLNIPERKWTRQDLAAFINSFDSINRYLIGIFERQKENLIGFYTLDVNTAHRTAQITAAIGAQEFVGRNVLHDTGRIFMRYLFEKRDIDKVSARVLSSNRRVVFNFLIPDLFHYEGRLREEVLTPAGKREDLLVFAAYKSRMA